MSTVLIEVFVSARRKTLPEFDKISPEHAYFELGINIFTQFRSPA